MTAGGRVLGVSWSSGFLVPCNVIVRTFQRNLLSPLSGLPNSVELKCGVSVLLKGRTNPFVLNFLGTDARKQNAEKCSKGVIGPILALQ